MLVRPAEQAVDRAQPAPRHGDPRRPARAARRDARGGEGRSRAIADDYRAAIVDWVEHGRRPAASPCRPTRSSPAPAPSTPTHARAAACFELGQHLWRTGGQDAAVPWWREAHGLVPGELDVQAPGLDVRHDGRGRRAPDLHPGAERRVRGQLARRRAAAWAAAPATTPRSSWTDRLCYEHTFARLDPCCAGEPWRTSPRACCSPNDEVVERHVGRGEFRGLEFVHVRAAAHRQRGAAAHRSRSATRSTRTGVAATRARTASPAPPTTTSTSTPATDFDRVIVVKVNAVERLRAELAPRALVRRVDRDGHEHRSVPAGRGQVPPHPRHRRGARRGAATRSRSSPRATLILRDLDVLTEASRAHDGARRASRSARSTRTSGARPSPAHPTRVAGRGGRAPERGRHPVRRARRAGAAWPVRRARAARAVVARLPRRRRGVDRHRSCCTCVRACASTGSNGWPSPPRPRRRLRAPVPDRRLRAQAGPATSSAPGSAGSCTRLGSGAPSARAPRTPATRRGPPYR